MSPNLGAFGDVYARTPNLDRLAAEGVCAPSRSSLILGMYAPSVGTQHRRSRRAPFNHLGRPDAAPLELLALAG